MRISNRFFLGIVMLGLVILGSAVSVAANELPHAVAKPDDQVIYTGEQAWFSANDSFDPDGDIASYFWDFQDGTFSTDPYTSHLYDSPGNYAVILTVTDNHGGTDDDVVNVTVVDVPPPSPTVWIDSLTTDRQEYDINETIYSYVNAAKEEGSEPPVWVGTLILEVFNTALVLVHSEQQPVMLTDVASAGTSQFEFNLTESGEYVVKATLYDNTSVFVDKEEIGISVLQSVLNQKPVAVATAESVAFNIGDPVRFSGNLSYDPDGLIASYSWDFGDGDSASEQNVTHVYDGPGEYTIVLTVVDDLGAASSDSLMVSVVDPSNEPPLAVAESATQKAAAGEEVLFYGDGSYDPDGIISSYHWDFGDGSLASGINVSHVFETPGNYTVILTVIDDSQGSSADIVFIEVGESGGLVDDPSRVEGGGLWNLVFLAGVGVLTLLGFTFGTEAGRYRVFGLLIPLYTKLKKEELLDDFSRGKIYGYILANPGDHYNSIKKALELSDGSFAHHIHILEKEGIVKSARDGIYRRFYPVGMKVPENGNTLRSSQILIIEKINETPGISQKEIATSLGVSSPTINYHIKELLLRGLIKAERAGMRLRYFVNTEKVKMIPKGKPEKEFVDMG